MELKIDKNQDGRIFQGIGGIFSNGMTKLLLDYPEKQREEILRYLFEDNFGASLQHVKVEIGSDVNTSSGTVPSHMRERGDFDITRGAELWIAAQAKRCQPSVTLEALRWGTPAWIENDSDKYLYYLQFLKGAREKFGLEFDYLACDQNEGSFDRDWVVQTLKPGLVRDGFEHVKLTAAESDSGWEIAEQAETDAGLNSAVDVFNCHYMNRSSAKAAASGKMLWMSEHLSAVRHDFVKGALKMAYYMLSVYPLGKMTMYEMHPALESSYPSTAFQYKCIISANTPWSGHYEVTKGLWCTAHFTQFIKPGWVYMDEACYAEEDPSGEYMEGCVALREPESGNWSMIFVNGTQREKEYRIRIGEGLSCDAVRVFLTTAQESFARKKDINPKRSEILLRVPPYSVCSVSTKGGQRKGSGDRAEGGNSAEPEDSRYFEKYGMMLPWRNDFSDCQNGKQPRFTSDQGGAFEVERMCGRPVLLQKITKEKKPKDWVYRTTPLPFTLIGSNLWTDYSIQADILLPEADSFAYIGERVAFNGKFDELAAGYLLVIYACGEWKIQRKDEVLLEGRWENQAQASENIIVSAGLSCCKNQISAWVNGKPVGAVTDSRLSAGQAALGSSLSRVGFMNLEILPIKTKGTSVFCKRFSDKDCRIQYEGEWKCLDGDYANFERTLTGSCTADSRAKISFTGTRISVLGNFDRDGGSAEIWLDGTYKGTVGTYCETKTDRKTKASIPETRNAICSFYDLAEGEHILSLTVKGDGWIRIDGTEIC